MPSYKLTYFNIKGRGEISRLLLTAAGQKFEDNRVEFADWPALKPKTPQGTLPVLTIDGKTEITQSNAVARFLAREFKLYGKDNLEAACIDTIVDSCLDMTLDFLPLLFLKDEEKKKADIAEFFKDKLPKYLTNLENQVKKSSTGFAVGKSVSLADLAIYSSFDYFPDGTGFVKDYPALKKNKETVEALPRLKTYLAARKN